MPGRSVLSGVAVAVCTQAVYFTAYEANHVPDQLRTVKMEVGEHKSPEYLEKYQPFGYIPVYEEFNEQGERVFKLYESRAISRYLNHLGGGSLVPSASADPHRYGLFEQFATTEASSTNPIISTILYQRIFGKFHGLVADEAVVQSKIEPLRKGLSVLNNQLKITKNFLLGDLTVVDIHYTPYLSLLKQTPEWKIVEEYPEVVAWIDRLTARPAWKKVLEAKF